MKFKRRALSQSSAALLCLNKRFASNALMATIGEIRLSNMRALITTCGTAVAFVDRVGTSSQYISQLENGTPDRKTGRPREMGTSMARRIENAFGRPPGWMDKQHPPEGDETLRLPEAHVLSHALLSDPLPRIRWEQLMTNGSEDLPNSLFVLPVGSNALLPRWQATTDIVWSRHRAPQPGKPVLVRDHHGRHHARVYREGREPGQWDAAALDPSFASFHSESDGLDLVAVYKGELDPDD